MILDTSAILAIVYEEPEGKGFLEIVYNTKIRRMSAANIVELSMVMESQVGSEAARKTEMFLRRSEIEIEPVTVEQAYLARQAFLDFGKGRHPAGLNYGDCFAYSLAKATGEALLFKGSDFSKTDVRAAATSEGRQPVTERV